MLELKNLKASIGEKSIIKGLNLNINQVKFMQLWVRTDLEKVL